MLYYSKITLVVSIINALFHKNIVASVIEEDDVDKSMEKKYPALTDKTIQRAAKTYIEQDDRTYGPISDWDVSGVTDFKFVFYGYEFSADISKWDVSQATSMLHMFGRASTFDADLSNWDVSSVTDMSFMFFDASKMNFDISKWNIGKVTKMMQLFGSERGLHDCGRWKISDWDVSGVMDAHGMFSRCENIVDLTGWNPSSLENMVGMFAASPDFNQDISKWDVSNVFNFQYTFARATSFNQNLSGWNMSKAKYVRDMFAGATDFRHALCWDMCNVAGKKERVEGFDDMINNMFSGSQGGIGCGESDMTQSPAETCIVAEQ